MEILKNRNKIILFLCIWVNLTALGQEVIPEINSEMVIKDITSNEDCMFFEEYIDNINRGIFNAFYLDSICVVHIPYKNKEIHSSEKFSYIMIYSLHNKNWTYKSSIPYYYNLKRVNANEKIFFSDNLFCSMNGDCNRLVEISRFDGNDLLSLVKYEGFDSTLYYDRLFVMEEKKDIINAIGDTICNDLTISDIKLNEKGLASFNLNKKFIILEGANSDSLETNHIQDYEKITYRP